MTYLTLIPDEVLLVVACVFCVRERNSKAMCIELSNRNDLVPILFANYLLSNVFVETGFLTCRKPNPRQPSPNPSPAPSPTPLQPLSNPPFPTPPPPNPNYKNPTPCVSSSRMGSLAKILSKVREKQRKKKKNVLLRQERAQKLCGKFAEN